MILNIPGDAMSKPRPSYQHHGAVYEADTCTSLVRAVEGGQARLDALVHGHYPGRKLPRWALPGVKTVGFWDTDVDADWGLDWHYNEGIELTLLERGRTGFAVDGHEYRLSPGDFTVTRPWQRHRVGTPNVGAGRLDWLILDVGVRRPDQPWRWPSWVVLAAPDREELTDILRHNEHPVWPAGGELVRCFSELAAAVESDEAGSSASRLTVLVNELLLLALEMFRRQDVLLDRSLSGTRRTVEVFLTALPGELAEEWTVPRLAQRCGLGVTQFNRYCRQLTNMTPLEYLNHLRLEGAAGLLVDEPELTVADVAARCGFASSQYFATAFRRRFGLAPRNFRAQSTR